MGRPGSNSKTNILLWSFIVFYLFVGPTAPSEYDAVYSDPDNSPSYVNHTVSSLKQSSIDDGHAYENTSVTASADNPDNLSDNSDADDEYEMIATREVPDHIYTKLNKQ